MKYIMESLKGKAGRNLAIFIIMTVIFLVFNTAELAVIRKVVEEDRIIWVHFYVLLVIIQTISNSSIEYFSIYRMNMYDGMLNKLVKKLTTADYSFFEKYSPGFLTKLISDLSTIVDTIRVCISIVRNVIGAMIILVFIAVINRTVILPVLAGLLVMSFIVTRIVKVWERYDNETEALFRKESDEHDEIINGFVEVRSFPKVAQEHYNSLISTRRSIFGLQRKKRMMSTFINADINIWCNLISVGIVLYVLYLKSHGVLGTSSQYITLIVYIWDLMNPIINISTTLSDTSQLLPKLKKYQEVMDYVNTVNDGAIELENFNDSISINGLSFSYDKSSTVLDNINIKILKGQKIGIAGASGCGKTTLLKLLNRFYDPDKGSITIDGIDIRKLTNESRRRFIGTIHQTPYIFNGTLRANILYGISRKVSDSELIEACRMAKIYEELIMDLPDGFETEVGPRGIKLSGGQKQRITIARMFLLNPEIIILDEATSALDNETEASIQDALKIFKNKTIISVAHRLSTIENSDVIYVFGNHSISEHGTHDELLKMNGIYAKMYHG